MKLTIYIFQFSNQSSFILFFSQKKMCICASNRIQVLVAKFKLYLTTKLVIIFINSIILLLPKKNVLINILLYK